MININKKIKIVKMVKMAKKAKNAKKGQIVLNVQISKIDQYVQTV